jgi:hypothetical protein
MRFAGDDMRDHIVSHKNDHGPSQRHYRALQRQERLRINFREIFGAARFSTFATVSANNGSRRPIPITSSVRASSLGIISMPSALGHFC